MKPRLASLTAAALLLANLSTAPAEAATPSSGTLSPTGTASLSWTGHTYRLGSTPDPAACLPATGDTLCDHFSLTVDADAAFWSAHPGGVKVSIDWPDSSQDFDLYVFDGDGDQVASSAGSADPESVTIPSASGAYDVTVVPFSVVGSGYTGSARIVSGSVAPTGGPAIYHGTLVPGANPDTAPENQPATESAPPLKLDANPVGRQAAEPTLGVDRDGTAFFAASAFDGPGGQLAHTLVMRSGDNGKTWQAKQPTVVGQDAHPITLDPYIWVDKDHGRVFDVDTVLADGAVVSFSDDKGESWTTSAATALGVNDHQTLTTGVVPEGSGLPTLDSAFPKIVYYCVNTLAAVSCSRSLDGGRTFLQAGSPLTDMTSQGCGALTGHLATDHAGRVFLPAADCGPLEVATSGDGGTTWRNVVVSRNIEDAIHDGSVAADAHDNLYVVWQDAKHDLPYLSISRDHGLTWSTPRMIAPPGVRAVNFPSIAAGDDGRIAISFPGTTATNNDDPTRPWNHYVVVSTNALDADPLFSSNISNPPDDPVHRGDCEERCGGMFDFLDTVVAPTGGGPAWASLSDDCVGDCVTDPSAPVADVGDGIAVREVSGPALTGAAACLPGTPKCKH